MWAAGEGRLSAPLRGKMRIKRIEVAVQGRQSTSFFQEHPDPDELLERQGVMGPQGLDSLDDDRWAGDEADERYLAVLFGDA